MSWPSPAFPASTEWGRCSSAGCSGRIKGPVSQAHLDYYLDEFTFRFNRRTSRHRGKLFFRLVQQAVAVDPVPYQDLVQHVHRRQRRGHKR
jgi:hypothetical protein